MSSNPPPDPGQVTTGAQPAAPAPNPLVAHGLATPFDVYSSMQAGYFGPLAGTAQPAMPQLDDPTMQQLANRIASLQQSHAVLNGSQPPDPNSVLARQTAHLSATDIASQVGQQTWQQSVMQPFHDFVDTWKRDWKAGLLETIGGAALVGGLIGLEAITGGAATPFIFAASAALVAPGMIQAWGNELQNPTDANLVKALVSTSTGIIAVGVPVKWSQGLAAARNGLSFALRAKKELESEQALTAGILSGRPEMRDMINFNRPIQEQLATLENRGPELRAQFEKFGVDLKDKTVADLVSRTSALDGLRKAWQSAKASKDVTAAAGFEAQMKAYAQTEVLPLRLQVASHYLFLADNKLKHVPLGPTESTAKLPAATQIAAQKAAAPIMGIVRQIARGHGLDKEQDLTARSLIEHQGRDMAAQGTGRAIADALTKHDELVQHLGLSDEQITQVELGLEDPQAWAKLSGQQQLYGQYRSTMHGAMTMAELRWGTIENAIAGYLPRLFEGTEETDHTAGVRDIFASLRGSMISRSRIYKAAVDARGDVNYYEKPRAQLMREQESQQAVYKAQRPLRDYMVQNPEAVRRERATLAGYKRHRSRYEKLGKDDKVAEMQAKIDRHYDTLSVSDPKLAQLAHMESNQFEAVQRITPSARRLITGTDLFRASFAGFAYRMEEASLRSAVQTHANLAVSYLGDIFGKKVSLAKYGLEIQQSEFKAQHALPDFMPETAFARGVDASKGYKQVFRAVGRPDDLHYRPALYARDELADEMHKIMEASHTGSETFSGVSGLLYKTVHGSKRFIMATPFWHAMNVSGRLLAFVLDDPVGAKTALSTVWGKGEHMLDPEARAALETRFGQAGGLHANRFEVTNRLHRSLRNNDAQATWPNTLRTLAGPLEHAYQDVLEGGFWKMVDDFQLAGFQLAEHKMRLKLPNAGEAEIQRLAAEYANNLAGMVNPLYMNKVYRHARNLIWFAPSYWATFTRSLMSMPGADRLSSFLATYRGGQFVRWGNVPLKAVSDAGRRELTRMQRSWVTTYLATGVVAADMLNVMLGGRHLWENDQGRMFDINTDNFAAWSQQVPVVGGLSPGGPKALPSGAVQHTYISAIPFFRQAADVMNALGFGHDWGLAHQFNDQTWQQADVLHKGLMAAGALADGVRRQSANKLGGVPQALYGGLVGEELSSRLGTGTQRQVKGPIGSWDALLNLVPGGLEAQRFLSQEATLAQEYPVGSPQYAQAQQQAAQQGAKAIGAGLLQQFTGFPSMYHMGPEKPPIDDSKMQSWYQERNNLHNALQQASQQMFMGDMTPLAYSRKRQQLLDRLIELDSITFGKSAPAAALANARQNIAQQLGLDNLGLSDTAWYARYQQFQTIWDATVQSASPAARSAWWEAEHSQWTDADYLVWEAQEMKKAVAAAVDGQGGNYITAFENQIASLQSLPLTTAERTKIEASDPYYYTYRNIIRAMSRSSALGAFINAFTSPFSETYILEQGLTPDEQQQAALLASGSASLITPETAKGLAAEAKKIATSPEVGAAGGEATGSPEFQQNLQQAVGAAETSA